METHSRRGLRKTSASADRDLWLWYSSLETKVTRKAVQEKAKLIFKESGILNFKASDGWYRRWIHHWKSQNVCQSERNCSPESQSHAESLSKRDQYIEKNVDVAQPEQPWSIESCHVPVTNCSTNNVNIKNKQTNLPQVSTDLNDCNLEGKINCTNTANNVLGKEKCVVLLSNAQIPSHEHTHFATNLSAVSHFGTKPILHPPQTTNFKSLASKVPNSCTSICKESSSIPDYNLNDNKCFIENSYEVGYVGNFSNEFQNNDSKLHTVNLISDEIECAKEQNNDKVESSLENVNDFIHNVMSDVSVSLDKQIFNSSSKISEQTQNGTMERCTAQNEEYAKRIIEPYPTSNQAKSRKKGERYLPKFKEKVLAYALNHSFKETAKKFKVNHATISMWKREKAIRKLLITGIYNKRLPKSMTDDIPDSSPGQDFIRWLSDIRLSGKMIKYDELREKARQIVSQNTQLKMPSWLQLWVERLNYVEATNSETSIENNLKRKHIKYPNTFKCEVAVFAEQHSQMQASKMFNVSRKRVFEWLQMWKMKYKFVPSEEIYNSNKKTFSSRSHKNPEDVDKEIWQWFCHTRDNGYSPNSKEVRQKGFEVYRSNGLMGMTFSYSWYRRWCKRFGIRLRHKNDETLLEWVLTQFDLNRNVTHSSLQNQMLSLVKGGNHNCKASSGWVIRFCKRHAALLQWIPQLSTPLPANLQKKVVDFQLVVQDLVTSKSLSADQIGCVDELHLTFNTPISGSRDSYKQRLLLRKPGAESCHATLILSCLADGTMLPPAIIMKTSSNHILQEAKPDVIFMTQNDGKMDQDCMNKWLQDVWFKKVISPNVLIADVYEPHTSLITEEKLLLNKSNLCVIPGGCSSKLQPLEIAVKRKFQASIVKYWEKMNMTSWYSHKHLQMASATDLVSWSLETYTKIKKSMQESIRDSFQVTGIITDKL